MQGEAQVRLVFAGEILEGFQLDEVKRRVGEAFKLDEARIAAMFSGARTVLKRSLSATEATRYVAQLGRLGARVHIEPLQAAPALAVAPAPAAAPPLAAAAPLPALAPLEEEITCPSCGERQSKRVLCRSCATDMPRGIAAKKEEAERARADRLDAARAGGRWAPPRSAGGEVASSATVDAPPLLGLSFEGRLGRISYLNAGVLAWMGIALIGIGAAVLLPMWRSVLMLVPLGLAFLLFFIWALRVTALRLHDFNRSGWWVLVLFIPYVGAIMSLALMVVPGSAEENDYGEKPRRGNVVVAVVVLVVSVIALLAIGRVAMSSYDKYSERSARRAGQATETASAADTAADPAAMQQAAQYLSSPAALDAFSEYARAPTYKAFAASNSGAWGWRSGKTSAREAASSALAACEDNRKPYTSECRLVNVNGQWPKER